MLLTVLLLLTMRVLLVLVLLMLISTLLLVLKCHRSRRKNGRLERLLQTVTGRPSELVRTMVAVDQHLKALSIFLAGELHLEYEIGVSVGAASLSTFSVPISPGGVNSGSG